MNKALLTATAVAALALAGAASAAPANWNGVYVDAGVGVGQWTGDETTINPTTGACNLCVTQTSRAAGAEWERSASATITSSARALSPARSSMAI